MISFTANGADAPAADTPDIAKAVAHALELITSAFSQRETIVENRTEADAALDRFSQAVDEITVIASDCQDLGLELLSRCMLRQLRDQQAQGCTLDDEQLLFLGQWRTLLESYLITPDDPTAFQSMVHYLQDKRWCTPLSEGEGDAMLELLRHWRGLGFAATALSDSDLPAGDLPQLEASLSLPDHEDSGDTATPLTIDPEADAERHCDTTYERVIEKLDAILENAEELELLGLHEVAQRVRSHAQSLRHADTLDEAALDMLARFPAVVRDYLTSPDIEGVSRALVDYLRDDVWPELIKEEEVEGILFLLHGRQCEAMLPGDEQTALATEDQLPESRAVEEVAFTPDALVQTTSMQADPEHLQILTATPEEAEPEGETAMHTETAYSQVKEEIAGILEMAEKLELLGLQETGVRVWANAEQYRNVHGLDEAIIDMLARFPSLVHDYLVSTDIEAVSSALIDYLQAEIWPQPIKEEEVAAMLFLLHGRESGVMLPAEEGTRASAQADAPDMDSGEPAVTTHEVVEQSAPMGGEAPKQAIPEQPSKMEDESAYIQVKEDLSGILDMAEKLELLGLMEIGQRVLVSVEKFHQAGQLDETVLEQLGRFSVLVNDYLSTSVNRDAALALIDYLRTDFWPAPIKEEEVDGMMFLLHDGMCEDPLPAKVETRHNTPSQELVDASSPEENATSESVMPDDIPQETSFVAEAQVVDHELASLLIQELTGIQKDMGDLLDEALNPEHPMAERQRALQNYADQLERIGLAAQAVGLLALHEYLSTVYSCISRSVAIGLNSLQHDMLLLLPGSLIAYLSAPDDPSTGEGLMDLLRGEIWDSPPDSAYVTALSCGLSMVELAQGSSDQEARQTQAQPEDVDLTLPSDLNQELLEGLLHELPLHTSEFSAAIQRLAEGVGTQTDLEVAKRAAHTLKGAANTVGVKGVANLTHHIEDILVALSKHDALPNRALAEVLSNAGDCLESMGEAVMGTGPEPDYAMAVLQSVLDWANRIDREGIPEDDSGVTSQTLPEERKATQAEESAPVTPAAPRQNEAMIRVPASLIDELLRLMGETIISTGQVRERLRRVIEQNKTLRKQNLVFLQLSNELEDLVDFHGIGGGFRAGAIEDEFDPLEFEHYSELHTVSRRLIEAATDTGELTRDAEGELDELNELIEVQERLHTQSQETVLRTRMLSVGTITSRLQRSVRQAARLLDKHVNLEVVGTETMIDSNILNELVDPLMHMLRNAVDHGIEAPDQRAAKGKDSEGRIELTFEREGNQVVVRCRDDGAGLDLATIRRLAEERGLVTPEQTLSDDEVSRLIFAPGFSTRSESTQVSGRGIGMDVVHSKVLQLKGSLALNNAFGQGLEIEVRLPATLISTYALLVKAQQHTFAISSYGVSDIHYVTEEHVQQAGTGRFFRLGDELYPLVDFASLLHLPQNDSPEEHKEGFPVLLVRQETGAMHAVRVQEILDSRELVVKNLGRFVPKLQGVVGATILGDGSVAAVIDIPELMRKPTKAANDNVMADGYSSGREHAGRTPSVLSALVVDDSLSARRATAQFMKDAGYDVRTAIDGLEAVSILENWNPDILLVDMEMPRMNGLELTAHVRARDGLAHLPIIMITSRSTEKHRRQAETAGVDVYLTKPFGDAELLQHITALTAAR